MRWNRYNYDIIYIELLNKLIAKKLKEIKKKISYINIFIKYIKILILIN